MSLYRHLVAKIWIKFAQKYWAGVEVHEWGEHTSLLNVDATTFSIMTLSIMGLSAVMLSVILFSVTFFIAMLNVVMLSVIMLRIFILTDTFLIVMLNVFMLNGVMLSVVMMSVVAQEYITAVKGHVVLGPYSQTFIFLLTYKLTYKLDC